MRQWYGNNSGDCKNWEWRNYESLIPLVCATAVQQCAAAVWIFVAALWRNSRCCLAGQSLFFFMCPVFAVIPAAAAPLKCCDHSADVESCLNRLLCILHQHVAVVSRFQARLQSYWWSTQAAFCSVHCCVIWHFLVSELPEEGRYFRCGNCQLLCGILLQGCLPTHCYKHACFC